MDAPPDLDAIRAALQRDLTIDIVTTGARTGQARETEIWFVNIDGGIYICGTPSSDGSPGRRAGRDWLANMVANPEFEFCLKESMHARVPARAEVVTDLAERARVMQAPETRWYRDQVNSIEHLIEEAPIVRVRFVGDFAELNG